MKTYLVRTSVLLNVALLIGHGFVLSSIWRARTEGGSIRTSAMEAKETLSRYEDFINARSNADTYLGMKVPVVDLFDLDGHTVSTDLRRGAGGLFLVFSPEQSCQPCLITLLRILQQVRETVTDPSKLPILAISDAGMTETRRFPVAFDLDFPFVSDTSGVILTDALTRITPLVLLANSEGRVISALAASTRSAAVLFFQRLMSRQLEHLGVGLRHSRGIGLEEPSELKVIAEKYDETSVKHLLQ